MNFQSIPSYKETSVVGGENDITENSANLQTSFPIL